MRRLYTKVKSNFEKDIFKFKESNYDFIRIHMGSNSICLTLVFLSGLLVSFKSDVFKWDYLKGVNDDLSFFIGLFSTIFGVWFFIFWKLNERSVYTFHIAKTKYIPEDVHVLCVYKDFSFGVGRRIWLNSIELPSVVRVIFCVGIFLCLALITLDNGGFDKLKKFPSTIFQFNTDFCPDNEENIGSALPKEGCELIIRAYTLGYVKDLGTCKPETIAPDKMEVCQKRRDDEPYFHYMSRLLIKSVEEKIDFFKMNSLKTIEDKFNLQLEKLEDLKDYRVYAISASPRASHHIWTNLSYPENYIIQKYNETLRPNYCIEKFQNQTNTISLKQDDKRKNSKLMEHIFGQLLFNPKSKNQLPLLLIKI